MWNSILWTLNPLLGFPLKNCCKNCEYGWMTEHPHTQHVNIALKATLKTQKEERYNCLNCPTIEIPIVLMNDKMSHVFDIIYLCRLPQWGLVRSVCLVPWSRCSLSLFHASWRVSLVSLSNLCPAEICSQPAWQVGQLLIFVSLKLSRSVITWPTRENIVFAFFFTCVICVIVSLIPSQTGESLWHLAVGAMAV